MLQHEEDSVGAVKRRRRQPREVPFHLNATFQDRRNTRIRKAQLELRQQADEMPTDRLNGLLAGLASMLDGIGVGAEPSIRGTIAPQSMHRSVGSGVTDACERVTRFR
jgi:hypothetical protein